MYINYSYSHMNGVLRLFVQFLEMPYCESTKLRYTFWVFSSLQGTQRVSKNCNAIFITYVVLMLFFQIPEAELLMARHYSYRVPIIRKGKFLLLELEFYVPNFFSYRLRVYSVCFVSTKLWPFYYIIK